MVGFLGVEAHSLRFFGAERVVKSVQVDSEEEQVLSFSPTRATVYAP